MRSKSENRNSITFDKVGVLEYSRNVTQKVDYKAFSMARR